MLPAKLRYPLGMCALLGVVFLWVGSGFVLENVFQDYKSPFFVTYFNTSAFAINLIPLLIKLAYNRLKQSITAHSSSAQSVISTGSSTSDNAKIIPDSAQKDPIHHTQPHQLGPESTDNIADTSSSIVKPLTFWQTGRVSAEFCLLWFIANYFNNTAYLYGNVASATIMASLSGSFTLIVSVVAGADSFSMTKVFGMIITLAGAVIVGLVDQAETSFDLDSPKNALLGDALALGGALFYAFYVTQLKLRVKNESAINMPLFFAFLGCINAIGLAPIIAILHVTGWETFTFPARDIFLQMVINALLGTVLSDYLWMFSTLLVGPIITTLGLSLTTPVSMLGEIVFHQKSFAPLYVMGACLIVTGFIFVNMTIPLLEKIIPKRFQRLPALQPLSARGSTNSESNNGNLA